ncbi:50S ribosomal protein L31, chloroplastic [Quercus robur]|uniref:50S ribosomal protein L31, chloroplastic n=1 Tax=Quercus lobata TaxID=97700 RepID=UPI0012463598|nr:50S ribosomal protein L31, chloroplastic [Quercus lobata]XP_050267494.1 50S ribosomal protein L31, chloroplastic [Quercus robur]
MALSLPNTFLQGKPFLPINKVTRGKVGTATSGNYPNVVTCRKKDIHPQFHEEAKVYCNGELVMTTGGTQKEYTVEVWSGNHPFYLGNRSALLLDDDQVEKFRRKYGEIAGIMEIPVLKGEIVLPSKRKSISPKGGKKK